MAVSSTCFHKTLRSRNESEPANNLILFQEKEDIITRDRFLRFKCICELTKFVQAKEI